MTSLPATGLRRKEPVHISKAIEHEMEELFAKSPEPRRSRCRFAFIDGKIRMREKLGREVPESLKRLRVRLKEASRKAYAETKNAKQPA